MTFWLSAIYLLLLESVLPGFEYYMAMYNSSIRNTNFKL
jgi:hypothetical protein